MIWSKFEFLANWFHVFSCCSTWNKQKNIGGKFKFPPFHFWSPSYFKIPLDCTLKFFICLRNSISNEDLFFQNGVATLIFKKSQLTLLFLGMYWFLGLYFVRVQWILLCYNATMNQPESRVYIGLVVVIHHWSKFMSGINKYSGKNGLAAQNM